ncbi:MAG: DNA polymerase III subunit epsilon, partial [Pseudomonadota bacterium]
MLEHWSLRRRIFLFFALIGCAGLVAIGGGLWLGYSRLGDPAALSAFVLAGLVAGFALLGVTAWVWMRFDEHVARAIETLSSLMRTRAHAGVDTDLDQLPGRYLGDLAPACEALGSALSESRTALDVAVERETARLAADKLRLEAILRDLSEGVLVCNPAHAIMLYNRQAVALLGAGGDLGLDRPLFTLLRAAPVQHAFERLETLRRAGGGVREGRDLLCSTVDGARLLQARMSLIAGDDDVTDGLLGYVLTFRDITEDLAAHAERDRLLSEFVDTTRRPAANLQTTLDVLASLGDGDREMRRRLQDSMAGEIGAFAAKVGRLADRYDAGRARSWPMSSISANDVLDSIAVRFGQAGAAEEGAAEAPAIPRSGAGRRIEAGAGRSVEIVPAPGIRLHCDAFALVELIALLLRSLLAMGYAEHVRLSVLPNGEPGTATGPRARQGAPGEVCVALSWEGEVLPVAHLERWLAEPLHVGYGGFSGREALESHGTELWPEAEAGGRARLCLPLATAAERVRAAGIDERAEFYDFDLAAQGAAALGDDHLLSQLTLVVFDTETT